MRDEDPICRNLKVKQDTFFLAAEKRGYGLPDIEERTGIPRSTLSSYKTSGAREPSLMGLATFIKLAKIPALVDLVSRLIEDSDLALAPKEPRTADWLAAGARAAAFASKVCQFQATGGFIDHVEDAELRTDMITIVSEGHGIIGGGK